MRECRVIAACRFLPLAVMYLVARPMTAQGSPPLQTLKIGTKVVSVAAVVRTKDGAPVAGLIRTDFQLKEDGKPQEIRYFSLAPELPLTLALMVDTSNSQTSLFGEEELASEVFFDTMLTRTDDRAMLVQFDTNVLELQSMTGSADALKRSLAKLAEPHEALRGGTLLYDAIYVTAKNALAQKPGRKAMVILTDGGDHGSLIKLDGAIKAAQKADTVIYSVVYSKLAWAYVSPHLGRPVLEEMAKQTGGKVFEVSAKTPLKMIYGEIAEDMRLGYLLGYNPPPSEAEKYHAIELKTIDKRLNVQVRKGYYTKQ